VAQQTINLGTSPGGAGGDDARTAFDKVNDNFNELYDGGVNQPVSAKLSAIAASVWAANTVMVATGENSLSVLTYAQFKTALGLEQVGNTSDADKPVSTAQQAALNTKLNLSGGKMTGAINEATIVALASAATVAIGAAAANTVTISGTTTITAFDAATTGTRRMVRFIGAMTLTHSSALQLPGAANIVTASGDIAEFVAFSSTAWICTQYLPISGGPVRTIPVSQGGTGATTTAGARANLGLGTGALLDATTSVEDPTVGRLLRVNDFGLGGTLPSINSDADTVAVSIDYWTVPGVTGTPASNYGYLQHRQSSDAQYATQTWQQLDQSTQWRRTKTAGTWSAWIQVLANDKIVGAVAGDVNSSAIFEYGNNANGRYIRYADGTQICWTWSVTTQQGVANGNVDYAWTFPINFVDVGYAISAGVVPNGSWDLYGVVGYYGKSANSVNARIRNGATAQTFGVDLMAVGRWK